MSLKKKVMLAGITAIFAFAVTIGSTYAWFTVTNEVTAQMVDINIQTATSLLIMMDDDSANTNTGYNLTDNAALLNNPSNYVTMLTTDMIDDYYDFSAIVMTPVTTVDGKVFETREEVPSTGVFVEFNVWVLSQSKSAQVTVSDLTLAADNLIEEKDEVINATRLSIVNGAGTASIFGWDKEYDFDDTLTGGGVILPADETTVSALESIYYMTSGTPVADESTTTLASSTTAFSLVADTPTKITIRIWIEGWDADCDNNLLSAVFTIAFGFYIKGE